MPSAERHGSLSVRKAPVGLYLHFPFCLSICPYCDFVVYAGRQARPGPRIDALVEALLVEIELRGAAAGGAFGRFPPLASVYLGGGTPSLLSAADVGRLLAAVDAAFGIASAAEVTIEANPGPTELGDLGGFRAAGVNRLSIGAQSLRDGELRRLGRRHSAVDVTLAVDRARRAGFDNVSLDLLYDVPGQTAGSWRQTLAEAVALEPDHVSAYALTLDDPEGEPLTGSAADHLPLRRGARAWRARARPAQDEDLAASCYQIADEHLSGAGLHWYELSNWSRSGRQSRHNLAYWRRQAHEGVGPGAHAFDGGLHRRWNAARLDGYLASLLPSAAGMPALPPGGGELLEPTMAVAEEAILALRTWAGLPASLLSQPSLSAGLSWGRAAGLVEDASDGALRLTTTGRLLASELFWRLLPEEQHRAA